MTLPAFTARLAGLTVPQLRAALAHEFGHYGNLDTRLGGITMRGRKAVLRTVELFAAGSTRVFTLGPRT